jgi:hypothetical protein
MKGREIMAPYEGRFKDKIIAAIDKAIKEERNAAMQEAARICREQRASIPTTASIGDPGSLVWNDACEYCAVEIEQSGG